MPLNSQYLQSLGCDGVREIICGINASRLAAYREATASDVEERFLYQLNARLSGLLLETLGGFEIVLRNVAAASIISSGVTGIAPVSFHRSLMIIDGRTFGMPSNG